MDTLAETPGMNAASLYERVMGESFARLAPAIQTFHRLSGRRELHGRVQTHAPASAAGRLLARCLGTPLAASSGAIRFELETQPEQEVWTRHFPSRTMSSTLSRAQALVVERLGMARLTFELHEADGNLVMRLRRLSFLGVPCPAWLMPRVVAVESGAGDQLHFKVQASLPLVGMIAHYTGHLVIPGPEQP